MPYTIRTTPGTKRHEALRDLTPDEVALIALRGTGGEAHRALAQMTDAEAVAEISAALELLHEALERAYQRHVTPAHHAALGSMITIVPAS